MSKVYVTKVFMNGGSQAIRIPAEFRFESGDIFVWKDELKNCISISTSKPSRMADFFDLQRSLLETISNEEWQEFDNDLSEIRKAGNSGSRANYLAESEK